MTKTTLTILDGKNVERKLTVEDNGVDGFAPYHLEDAVQRAALVAAIGATTTAVQAVSAAHATAAKQDQMITALNSLVSTSGSSDPIAVTSATFATAAKQDQQITALGNIDTKLAGTLAVSGPLTSAQLTTAALATAAKQDTMVAALAALLKVNTVVAGTPTDRSGTITAGGTAQSLMAANANRRGFWVQNNGTNDLWINEIGTATATQPSMRLPAGAFYETPASFSPVGLVSIFGATTGQTFSAREW